MKTYYDQEEELEQLAQEMFEDKKIDTSIKFKENIDENDQDEEIIEVKEDLASDIIKANEKGILVYGEKVILKELKRNNLEVIYYSKNLKEELQADLEKYAKINNIKLINTNRTNEELGIILKKMYFISLLGIKKN